MFSTIEILVAIVAAGLGYYYYLKLTKDAKALPEPFGLPIVGHIPFLGTQMHKKITQWSKTYGNIFKLNLGGMKSVILSDAALVREAYNMPAFNGRTDLKSVTMLQGGKNGIVSSENQVWVEQRRFAIRHLRDFGFGKSSMETVIMEDVKETIERLRSDIGKPISVQTKFSLAVLNSLWKMCTNIRYSHDDPKLNELLEISNDTFNMLMTYPMLIFFPTISEWLSSISGWKTYIENCTLLRNFFKDQISEHKRTYEENNSRDLIDVYLEEINKTTDPQSSFYGDSGDKQLIAVLADMFGAGSETSSSLLQWSVLYLSQNQDIQRKFRKEIVNTIGNRTPSLEDRAIMPYTEALIMELLRKSLITPVGVLHTTTSEIEFHGYRIPKGYGVVTNIHGIHNDPSVWGDPEKFRPDRFLDENGQCIKKHDSLITFSVGKRACIGETLARDTFFLFLTSIFQTFEVLPEPGVTALYEPIIGFVWRPKSFNVIFNEI